MDDVVPTFPLLRLPKKAVLNTFRIISLLEIFGISFLSKKTKNLVESLKIKLGALQVSVGETFDVHLHFSDTFDIYLQLYQVGRNRPLRELGTPERFLIRSETPNVRWTNSLTVKQLLDHSIFIFHCPIAALVFRENYERFSLESVFENVKDFKAIVFYSGNHENNIRALRLMRPAIVDVKGAALIDNCVPRDILIHNSDLIRSSDVQNTLDDLLVTNARFICFTFRILSWKTVNKFLKLWVKGSNPRLECAVFHFPDNIQLDEELFSGLKYENAPPRRVRLFKTACLDILYEVPEGRDIWRCDGTQATVMFDIIDNFGRLRMFVWHDHCAVN